MFAKTSVLLLFSPKVFELYFYKRKSRVPRNVITKRSEKERGKKKYKIKKKIEQNRKKETKSNLSQPRAALFIIIAAAPMLFYCNFRRGKFVYNTELRGVIIITTSDRHDK